MPPQQFTPTTEQLSPDAAPAQSYPGGEQYAAQPQPYMAQQAQSQPPVAPAQIPQQPSPVSAWPNQNSQPVQPNDFSPQAYAQPNTGFQQPAGQMPNGLPSIDTAEIAKIRKRAVIFSVLSIVTFVAGFLLGYAAAVGAFFGAMAIRNGKQSGSKGAMIAGSIGLILNLGFFILAKLTSGN